MPIVIRELVIRVTAGEPSSNGRNAARPDARPATEKSERSVAAAVERVLEILKREKER